LEKNPDKQTPQRWAVNAKPNRKEEKKIDYFCTPAAGPSILWDEIRVSFQRKNKEEMEEVHRGNKSIPRNNKQITEASNAGELTARGAKQKAVESKLYASKCED